jgi:hypothetical protein
VQMIEVGPWTSQKCASEIVKSMFSGALISTASWCAGRREGGSGYGSADRAGNAEGCGAQVTVTGSGAVSGRGSEEALHRFQQDSGVAMSRGDRRWMCVVPAGVDMSWCGCKRSAGLEGIIRAATAL